jgi:hypothetical protein
VRSASPKAATLLMARLACRIDYMLRQQKSAATATSPCCAAHQISNAR